MAHLHSLQSAVWALWQLSDGSASPSAMSVEQDIRLKNPVNCRFGLPACQAGRQPSVCSGFRHCCEGAG